METSQIPLRRLNTHPLVFGSPKKWVSDLSPPEIRYNQIVVEIIEMHKEEHTERSVELCGVWRRQHGPYGGNLAARVPAVDSEKLIQIVHSASVIVDIIRTIEDLAETQKSVIPREYAQAHDHYLQILMEFHDVNVVQATTVLDLLRAIQIANEATDTAGCVTIIGPGTTKNAELPISASFARNKDLHAAESDIDKVLHIIKRHRELYIHVAGFRTEILNYLADNAGLSATMHGYALNTMSESLGPKGIASTGMSREALRKQNMSFYFKSDTNKSVSPDHGNEPSTDVWCHISKREYNPKLVVNAHIVPANTHHGTIRAAFGDPDPGQILNSPRNFLFLYDNIETAFDQGRISVVPHRNATDEQHPIEFRLFFIDRSLVTQNKTYANQSKSTNIVSRWSDLAKNPVLGFRNDLARPGLRNLFYHCITSLAKAKHFGYPGYADALSEFEKKIVWPTTGPWVSKTIMSGLASTFQIPQIYRSDALIDEDEAAKLCRLYDVSKMSCLITRRNIVKDDQYYSDDEDEEAENQDVGDNELYVSVLLGPGGFRSPRHMALNEAISTAPRWPPA